MYKFMFGPLPILKNFFSASASIRGGLKTRQSWVAKRFQYRHTYSHTYTFWFFCLYGKKTAHPFDVYCLFIEGSQLFTCFASQTLGQTPSLSFQKNIPSVVHFYPNRWSMLVLFEPSQGGKCGRKKEKWFTYGVTWGHKKTQFLFAMGNTHNGRKVYCLLLSTVNTFLFVCRHTGKRLATQD